MRIKATSTYFEAFRSIPSELLNYESMVVALGRSENYSGIRVFWKRGGVIEASAVHGPSGREVLVQALGGRRKLWVRRQAAVLSRLRGARGSLQVLEVVKHAESRSFCFVFERPGLVSLRSILPIKLEFSIFARFVRELLSGVEELHSRGVIHAGLSPESVLLDPQTGETRLAGFQNSEFVCPKRSLRLSVENDGFLPPEALRRDPEVCPKFDIWAAGAVIAQAAVGSVEPIFAAPDEETALLKIQNFADGKKSLDVPAASKVATPELFDLLRWMLQPLPENRPTVQEALQHPFFLL